MGKTIVLDELIVRPYDRLIGSPPSVIDYGIFSEFIAIDGEYKYMFYANGSDCSSGGKHAVQMYTQCGQNESLSEFHALMPCFYSITLQTPAACGVSMAYVDISIPAVSIINDPAGTILCGLALAGVAAFIVIKKACSKGQFNSIKAKFAMAKLGLRQRIGCARLPNTVLTRINTDPYKLMHLTLQQRQKKALVKARAHLKSKQIWLKSPGLAAVRFRIKSPRPLDCELHADKLWEVQQAHIQPQQGR